MIPEKICVVCDCGAGDFFRSYFTSKEWKTIQTIKDKNPRIKIRALVSSSNDITMDILSHNYLVDEIKRYPWSCRESEKLFNDNLDYFPLTSKNSDLLKIQLTKKIPQITLTKDDKKFIKSLKLKKDFVIMHPFSGNHGLTAFPPGKYIPLINKITDKLNYQTILVGATFIKRDKIKKEYFRYAKNNFINLVNKTNGRVCGFLSQQAKYFIGTRSCFFNSAMPGKAKIILLVRDGQAESFKKITKERWENYRQPIVIPITNTLSARKVRQLTYEILAK